MLASGNTMDYSFDHLLPDLRRSCDAILATLPPGADSRSTDPHPATEEAASVHPNNAASDLEEDDDAMLAALFPEEVLRSKGWATWGAAKESEVFRSLTQHQQKKVQILRRKYQGKGYAEETRRRQKETVRTLRKQIDALKASNASLNATVASLRKELKCAQSRA